jgi:CheY-like chemotaxis protein
MDLSLPRLDGWEATRRLKSNPATCDIPVIAFTAHILPSDLERARAAGCATVIAKPFEIDVFLAQIDALLDQHTPVRSRRVGA